MSFSNRFNALRKLMDEQQESERRPTSRSHEGLARRAPRKPTKERKKEPVQTPPDMDAFPSLAAAPAEKAKPVWPIVREDPAVIAARKKALDAEVARNEGKQSKAAEEERLRITRNKALNERFSKSAGNIVDALAEDGSDDEWDL